MIAERLHGFVELLRDNEIAVATAEFADCLDAIELIGIESLTTSPALLAVLLTTLAKSEDDEETLRRLFQLHFHSPSKASSPTLEESLQARGLNEEQAQEFAERLRDEMNADTDTDAIARALLEGDTAALRESLQRAAAAVDLTRMQTELQVGYFAQQIMNRIGLDDIEQTLRCAVAGAGSATGEGAAMLMRGLVDERMLALRREARSITAQEQKKRNFTRERTLNAERNEDRAFARLLRQDLARMRPDVERLASRLLSRVRTRDRKARRGRLDLARTLRANIAHDGVPVRRHFKRKRRDRPEIVVLCDISDSVRSASLFMLELVYALSERFRRVRSFVFVDDIGEATDLFAEAEVDEAIEEILAGAVIPASTSSDYGAAFKRFASEHLDSMTRRTTVVILGDGRCNHRPHEAWVVEEMARRARTVFWLCPEERSTWGSGDSEMPAYERASSQVHVVRNLRQLAKAVDQIVP